MDRRGAPAPVVLAAVPLLEPLDGKEGGLLDTPHCVAAGVGRELQLMPRIVNNHGIQNSNVLQGPSPPVGVQSVDLLKHIILILAHMPE